MMDDHAGAARGINESQQERLIAEMPLNVCHWQRPVTVNSQTTICGKRRQVLPHHWWGWQPQCGHGLPIHAPYQRDACDVM